MARPMASSRQPRPVKNLAKNGMTTPVTSARKKLAAFRPTRLGSETEIPEGWFDRRPDRGGRITTGADIDKLPPCRRKNPSGWQSRLGASPLAPEALDLAPQLVNLVLQVPQPLLAVGRTARGNPPRPGGRAGSEARLGLPRPRARFRRGRPVGVLGRL